MTPGKEPRPTTRPIAVPGPVDTLPPAVDDRCCGGRETPGGLKQFAGGLND
jgi:hypothetical protein